MRDQDFLLCTFNTINHCARLMFYLFVCLFIVHATYLLWIIAIGIEYTLRFHATVQRDSHQGSGVAFLTIYERTQEKRKKKRKFAPQAFSQRPQRPPPRPLAASSLPQALCLSLPIPQHPTQTPRICTASSSTTESGSGSDIRLPRSVPTSVAARKGKKVQKSPRKSKKVQEIPRK